MTIFAEYGSAQNYSTQEDAKLINAVRNGQNQAFTALYNRYFDAIYRYVFFRVADQGEAEDLTQRIFLNLLEAIINQQAAINELKPYLFRSAHNMVVDHYRQKRPNSGNQLSISTDEAESVRLADPLPEEQVITRQEHIRIVRALATMDPASQQIITCRFINNLSSRETAQIMGVSEGHLRVLQYRALKKLRELFTGKEHFL